MKKIKVTFLRIFNGNNEIKIFSSLINSINEIRMKKNESLLPEVMPAILQIDENFELYSKLHFINNHSNLKSLKILFKNLLSQITSDIDLTVNPKVGFKTLTRLINIFNDSTKKSFFEVKKQELIDFIDSRFNKGILKTSVILTVNNDFKLPDFINVTSFITAEEILSKSEVKIIKTYNELLEIIK